VVLQDLYTMSPAGAYWYSHGFNLSAVYALIAASLISFLCVMVPALSWLANFSWFIGVAAGALFYRMLSLQRSGASAAMAVATSQRTTEEA
jgi:NCS1 family nucleobase:cation symporter-1